MDATSSPLEVARAYYRTIDGEGDRTLEDLLAADVVQERADRTIRGREAFARFVREERPEPDTTHELSDCFRAIEASGRGGSEAGGQRPDAERVAVQGVVRRTDGTPWFGFLDVFTVADGRIARIDTYTR